MKRIVVTKDTSFRVGQHEVVVPPGRYTQRALDATIRALLESAVPKMAVRMEKEER